MIQTAQILQATETPLAITSAMRYLPYRCRLHTFAHTRTHIGAQITENRAIKDSSAISPTVAITNEHTHTHANTQINDVMQTFA